MLKERMQGDLKKSQLKREEVSVSTLRLLLSAVNNKEIEKRTRLSKSEPFEKLEELSKLSEGEIIEAISSEIKKRKEAILEYEKGGRQDLAEKEKREAEVLEKYLPEQLPEAEIQKLVKKAIEKTGAKELKDMGKVMAELMPQIKGKADGSLVSKIVKESLS